MIKTYLRYLIGNFPKKLLNFAIASSLALTFSLQSFTIFIIHYFQYLSVYFFNDLIDRKEDLKRKFIIEYKLELKEKQLFCLGVLHFIIPLIFLWLINPKIAILSTLIVLFGILRSYIKIKPIRELTLGFLQFAQILFFGYILMKLDSIIEHVSAVLTYSFQYVSLYASHKFEFLRSVVYIIVSCIFLLLSLPLLEYNQILYIFLISMFITSITSLYLFKNTRTNIEFKNHLQLSFFLSFIPVFILFYSIQQPVFYEVAFEFKEIKTINETIRNFVTSILNL